MDKVNGAAIEVKVGRPSLGVTKKVSITLEQEEWEQLEILQKDSGCGSRSELLRKIIRNLL